MPVQSPYLSIINKQAQIMVKAAAEMGFTPSSRSRISVDTGVAIGNEFDGF
jgi:phage terminase small subunit